MDPSSTEDIRDIHGYHAIDIPVWFWWTLGVLSLILLGWFVYNKFFKKDRIELISNYEFTVRELKNLGDKCAQISSKSFYLQYSELVKRYLQNELSAPTADKTIEELRPILFNLESLKTNQALFILESFSRADLAKFAKHEIKHDQKLADLEKILGLIDNINQDLIVKKKSIEQAQNENQNIETEVAVNK